MLDYDEPLITADKVLDIFSAQNSAGGTHSSILQTLKINHGTPEAGYLLSALERIRKDELLLLYGHNNDHYKIGADFLTFKANGGYRGFIDREKLKINELDAIKLSGLTTNRNVIDTGDSVQKLNKLLRPTTIIQVVTGIITLGVACIALWVSYLTYNYQKTNDDLEKRLKQLEEKIPQIQKQQTRILQSEVKDTVYLTEKNKK